MIGKEVKESEPITGSQVKKIIEDYAKVIEDYEEENKLNLWQNLTINHLARFERYSPEDAEEIFNKLQDEFGLRARVAAHIVDLVPKDLADMRLIFAKEPTKTDKEDMEKILEMLEQYDVEE